MFSEGLCSPTEPLKDVQELQILIIDVQRTNLDQQGDVLMLHWTRISEEWFPHLVESVVALRVYLTIWPTGVHYSVIVTSFL